MGFLKKSMLFVSCVKRPLTKFVHTFGSYICAGVGVGAGLIVTVVVVIIMGGIIMFE